MATLARTSEPSAGGPPSLAAAPCGCGAQSGFTVLEAMVAVSVLAILALGLCASVVALTRLNEQNRSASIARSAVRSVIEEAISLGGVGIDTLGAEAAEEFLETQGEQIITRVGTGTVALRPRTGAARVLEVTIDEVPAGALPGGVVAPPLYHVYVLARWQDFNGTGAFEVSTRVTDRNISD